ncbi:hypothetical protein HOE22_00470 [Candidatus Woesearchaeota archaeon]|nr:hypothetical protein [Candidatus Woesearchaeota archaeon]MBT4206799.1 hypothetical protein [Candidatus Woesearchaeota archaeon]MBT4732747.1 hypothetical protein [Candidatus Woesearchaeota archaeon]MBT5111561.1 hypothetical protein [Candidatus Woesearchaeota archaeon]MBT7555508.1 hypothetical protein [Candidatus Woesearchaeota archaeon]
MNTGDSAEFSEDNYTAEQNSNNQPQVEESPQNETEEVEYEYVDEDGNPVSEDELEGYAEEVSEEVEYVDEDGNPVSEDEIETKEIQEPERTFSQEETNIIQAEEPVQEIAEETIQEPEQTMNNAEEILQDIKDISGIPMKELRSNIIQAEEPVQEIAEETIQEPERTFSQEETNQQPEQTFSQEETNIIQAEEPEQTFSQEETNIIQAEEPVQETIQETVEPIIETQPLTEEKPVDQLDVDHFISNAQKAQEIIEQQPIQEPPRVVSTLNPIQQPEQPTIQETVEPVKTEKELDVDHFISNAQKAQESMKESVEPDQIQKPDDTEELLQRLTMGKSTASRAVQDNSEDTKENPYIYRQGHPHLDSHTDLDKIRKITEKLFFSSDEGANKMKEHRKKTKFSI